MARKGRSTEEIIAALREGEVRISRGETVGMIRRSLGVSEQMYHEWQHVCAVVSQARATQRRKT